ncbi:hypothetical protein ABW19_dt0200035 [Dactylella cylindrospora]|nr:hypothetical protein ABW19_dt0200035 [Dactylella cylindrospora]
MRTILALAAFVWATLACSSTKPITIPWKTVGANSKGIPLHAGSYQELGLGMSTMFSITRVYSNVACNAGSGLEVQGACQSYDGSTLDTSSLEYEKTFSTPYNFSMDPNDEFIANQPILTEEGHIAMAVNTSSESFSLGDYPVMALMLEEDSLQKAVGIGMGKLSTFLEKLYDRGHVPSKVFGFSQGSYSEQNPLDARLTIGGIDPNAMSGEFRNFTIAHIDRDATGKSGLQCPLQVIVSIFKVSAGGETHDLVPAKHFQLPACVDTFQQDIIMPESMMSQLLDITGAAFGPPDSSGLSKPWIPRNSDKKIVDITITLQGSTNSGNFDITIPGNEITNRLPERNDYLQFALLNRSDSYPVDGTLLPPMILGGIFLSQQYLVVDYSRDIFSLAPAVHVDTMTDREDLVTICDQPVIKMIPDEGDKSLAIAMIVLTGIGWLLVFILGVTAMVLWKRPAPVTAQLKDEEEVAGKYGEVKVVERPLSSLSDTSKASTTSI